MWDQEIVLTVEESERLRKLLYGTHEEKLQIEEEIHAQHVKWEHELLQQRAYALWEQAGCPHGRDVEFWLAAEVQWNKEVDDYEPCICNGVAY